MVSTVRHDFPIIDEATTASVVSPFPTLWCVEQKTPFSLKLAKTGLRP
jgi:hypothetical protein